MPSSLPARSMERSSGSSGFGAAFWEDTALITEIRIQLATAAGQRILRRPDPLPGMESRPHFFESSEPLPQAVVRDQPLRVTPRQAAADEFLLLTRELPLA